MIDIEEMIGKRRYRVALPPEEIFSRIDTHFLSEISSSLDITEWHVTEHEERYCTYLTNLLFTYIATSCYTKNGFDLKKVEEAQKEFYEKKLSDEILGGYRDSVPVYLHILIRKVDEFGCECEGICQPALYLKLGKGLVEEEQIKNFRIT